MRHRMASWSADEVCGGQELDSEVPPVILPSCLRPSPLLPQHAAHLLAPAPIVPASRPLFTATIVPPAAAPPESVAAHLAPAVVAQLAAHPPALPPLAAPQPGVARPLVAYQPPVALKVPAAHSRKRTD
jgi:hypothetical protein